MIVLDTHALVWWVDGDERLSTPAAEAIAGALERGERVVASAISAWEMAMLVVRGRIALAMDLDEWLRAVESLDGVDILPITSQLAVQSVSLPGEFHADPADRIIVALARAQNAVLITADQKIQRYPHVRWVW